MANLLKEKVMWFTVWCVFVLGFSWLVKVGVFGETRDSWPGIKAEKDKEMEQMWWKYIVWKSKN